MDWTLYWTIMLQGIIATAWVRWAVWIFRPTSKEQRKKIL